MGERTGIQWCHHTFNPWRGCQRVSPGCEHCYAETLSARNPKVLGEWGPKGVRAIASESYWRQPLAWDRAAKAAGERRRVFCASLADVFEDRPELEAPRSRLWEIVDATPNLDWLVLTKRPENIGDMIPDCWNEKMPVHLWLGVSCEDQPRADERIPLLLQTPAAVRFVSAEPLLGPIQFGVDGEMYDYGVGRNDHNEPRLHWIIVGGESGPGARMCRVEWVRSIVNQCREAGTACFVKQLGAAPVMTLREWNELPGPRDRWTGIEPAGTTREDALGIARLLDRKGGDPSEWPEDLRVREFPALFERKEG